MQIEKDQELGVTKVFHMLISLKKYHPFHLVTPSPWPFLISVAAFTTAIGATMYMHFYKGGLFILFLGLLSVILVLTVWWRDVIREATFDGMHTLKVQKGLRMGFILFIVSEVMFFFGFFWAFFHVALSPAISIGCIWPPFGITPFDPRGVPLVNTLLYYFLEFLYPYSFNLVGGDF